VNQVLRSYSRSNHVAGEVREEKPYRYLKVVASVLPRKYVVTDANLEEMSDDELVEELAKRVTAQRAQKEVLRCR
jgi:hypothetical protein